METTQMLKTWCINLSFFAMLCKNLVHLQCILCPSIWQTYIDPRSNLPLLDICRVHLSFVTYFLVKYVLLHPGIKRRKNLFFFDKNFFNFAYITWESFVWDKIWGWQFRLECHAKFHLDNFWRVPILIAFDLHFKYVGSTNLCSHIDMVRFR